MATFRKSRADQEEQEAEEIHGDILESILSHVPLVYLVPLLHVSKSWNLAVSSSLQNLNRLEPWLVIHTQYSCSPYTTTTRAYDPRSRVWVHIEQPSIKYVSTLRSSHSNLLYMLSPSRFSFSFDPLHMTWHHVDAPLVWRGDSIVAVVGHRIVVAGGTCDFEDDPFPVEIYDVYSGTWSTCDSMPAVLKDSVASMYLSIASNNHKLFVSEKYSGVTYSFDPETLDWYGPYDLRPDPYIFYSVIGFSDDRLVLIGLVIDGGGTVRVKLWEVNCESFKCEEIGEMPLVLTEKLKSSKMIQLERIGVCLAGKFVYIYNPSEMEEVIVCEILKGNCWWDSVGNVIISDRRRWDSYVFTCSNVGMDELQRAMKSGDRRFVVKL